jgi:hypothetical protein
MATSEVRGPPPPVSDLKPYNNVPGSHRVLKDVYSFFGNNITKSIAIYIGCLDWKKDLQLLETYAVPTIICDPYNEQPDFRAALAEKRGKLIDWMKFLKESNCANHFVNPKWIENTIEYPGNFNGTRSFDDGMIVPVSSWETLLNKANDLRVKSKVDDPHFAICRIELFGEESQILASLLASKYRPSLLYVRWSASPDESQEICEAAGHVQTSGYRLIDIDENGFFLYQYSGQDVYSCCSWTKSDMSHPFIGLIKEQVLGFIEQLENARLDLLKYSNMLKMGVSADAVHQKMLVDGLNENTIAEFFSEKNSTSLQNQSETISENSN